MHADRDTLRSHFGSSQPLLRRPRFTAMKPLEGQTPPLVRAIMAGIAEGCAAAPSRAQATAMLAAATRAAVFSLCRPSEDCQHVPDLQQRLQVIGDEMVQRVKYSKEAQDNFAHSHQAYRWVRKEVGSHEASGYRRLARQRNRVVHDLPSTDEAEHELNQFHVVDDDTLLAIPTVAAGTAAYQGDPSEAAGRFGDGETGSTTAVEAADTDDHFPASLDRPSQLHRTRSTTVAGGPLGQTSLALPTAASDARRPLASHLGTQCCQSLGTHVPESFFVGETPNHVCTQTDGELPSLVQCSQHGANRRSIGTQASVVKRASRAVQADAADSSTGVAAPAQPPQGPASITVPLRSPARPSQPHRTRGNGEPEPVPSMDLAPRACTAAAHDGQSSPGRAHGCTPHGAETTSSFDRPSQPHRTCGTAVAGATSGLAPCASLCPSPPRLPAAASDARHPSAPRPTSRPSQPHRARGTADAGGAASGLPMASAAIALWECPAAFHLKRMIIGNGGKHVHHIQDHTGTKVWYSACPPQLELRASSDDDLRLAMDMAKDLVQTVRSAFDRWTEQRPLLGTSGM